MGMATPPVGAKLQTLTFENELGSTQSSEWFSPMFGMSFKKGVLPAGQAPEFRLTNGTIVAASIWNVASWNDDGSVEQCSCLLRVPSSVVSGGSLDIEVYSGGIFPSANSLALSSASAADLKLEATGTLNLSGVWTCSLSDGITRNNHVILLGSGDAGSYYKVGCEFRDGSAVAHGQLYGWFYVFLMRNSSGGFAGMRHILRAGQVWVDVTSPAVTARHFTAVYKSGATTIRTLAPIVSAAGDIETVGTEVRCSHHTTFYCCGADGEMEFSQSGGTLSADSSMHLRRVVDEVLATRMFPPMDKTVTPTPLTTTNYAPYCKGKHITYSQGGTGERQELGVLPSWACAHIITQNKAEERAVRVSALASGGYVCFTHKVGTKRIPITNDIRSSYAGLGTIQTTWRFYQEEVNNTPVLKSSLWSASGETQHRPGPNYYAYCITGEQQYLDMLVEIGNQGQMWAGGSAQGGPVLRTEQPITALDFGFAGFPNPELNGVRYKGAGYIVWGQLARNVAWYLRDMMQVAAVYPDACPEGTETRLYFRDLVKSNFDLINDYNAAMSASWRDQGLYLFNTGPDGFWATGYFSNVLCNGTSIYPTTEGVQFRQHIAKMWNTLATVHDFACASVYQMEQWKSYGRIDDLAQLTYRAPAEAACTFNATTNVVTRSGSNAWTPTNGDRFCFYSTYKPFGGTDGSALYYVVNASGATFQLAATPGGAPLDITVGSASTSDFALAVADWRPLHSFQNTSAPSAYYPNLRSVVRYHNAVGDTMTASMAALTRNDALPAASASLNFSSDPKFAFATTFPA